MYFPAETSTPPLLDSTRSSETELFVCRTRTCIQPSHYFRASTSQATDVSGTCFYGAKHCPSKLARARKQDPCHYVESEKEDSPSVEDAQLLRAERSGCCKEPPPEHCGKSSHEVIVHESKCCKKEEDVKEVKSREDSPQITCCHNAMTTSTDSQERILQ
jgi:hypothetical protein